VGADAALITQHNNCSRREHVAPLCMNAVVLIEEKKREGKITFCSREKNLRSLCGIPYAR